MSLSSWREEFVICDTEDASNSDLEAIDHALQKFKGLKKKNLKKHNCRIVRKHRFSIESTNVNRVEEVGVPAFIKDNTLFDGYLLTYKTCALCERHLKTSNCRECPLFKVLGGLRCDSDKLYPSPFGEALDKNPKLMLRCLGKARNKVLGIIDPIHVWGIIAVMIVSLLCGLFILLKDFF